MSQSLKRSAPDDGLDARPTKHATLASSNVKEEGDEVYTSEPIHDRQSIFQAYFSPTQAWRVLQSHPDIASATHRMAGWRLPSNSQKTLTNKAPLIPGSDDDGEKFGGKRILSVLTQKNVQGSLVVARWYGGVMLGPVRFTHIENVSREAIQNWENAKTAREAKEKQELADQQERKSLLAELQQRDESITALRGLLERKKAETAKSVAAGVPESGSVAPKSSASPQKAAMVYDEMPLPRLRMLDKARDSTIAFLLKQIDAAEK